MADRIDEAASAFQNEIAPTHEQPRNERGQFESTAKPVDRLFQDREFEDEGDGDGDETSREQSAKPVERPGRKGGDSAELEGGEDGREEGETETEEPDEEGVEPDGEADEDDGEAGPHYEVKVDGETKTVSLKEALEGYIRTETFHQRMNKLSEAAQIVSQENTKSQQARDYWIKRAQDLEGEFDVLLPKEPNWDDEFARDPRGAHLLKKQFDEVKGRIDAHRQERLKQEQLRTQEQARMTADFAARGQAKFINDHNLHDEAVRTKVINRMRQTAFQHGFSEKEVSEVFDPRMLDVLFEAAEYRRIKANKPKPVIPGKAKSSVSGSGNGASRRTDRRNIDSAQRRLAESGSLEDAANFFKTVL